MSGKPFVLGSLLLLVVLFALTGWLSQNAVVPAVVMPTPDTRGYVVGDAFPKTLVDAYGFRLKLERPPRRIVSGMLAADEMLLDLIPRERILAVTPYAQDSTTSNCAVRAKDLPTIPKLGIEQVIAFEPDLVLTARFSDIQVVSLLRQCSVPVFCFGRYDSLKDIQDNVSLLGKITGAEKRSREIIEWMDAVLQEVEDRTKDAEHKPRVLYYSLKATHGRNTILNEIITKAGGRNVADEIGIYGINEIALEKVLALNPEVIIVPESFAPLGGSSQDTQPSILSHPEWQSVRAVQEKRVYVLSRRHLDTISHHVVKAAADMAHVFHPDRVPKKLAVTELPPLPIE
ncbi:MAG: ABC transporter substrate-binding protein [Gemmataceae bacterium]